MAHCREKSRFGLVSRFRFGPRFLSGIALACQGLLAFFQLGHIAMHDQPAPIRKRYPVCFDPLPMTPMDLVESLAVKKLHHSGVDLGLELGTRHRYLAVLDLPAKDLADVAEAGEQISG